MRKKVVVFCQGTPQEAGEQLVSALMLCKTRNYKIKKPVIHHSVAQDVTELCNRIKKASKKSRTKNIMIDILSVLSNDPAQAKEIIMLLKASKIEIICPGK